MNPSFRRGLVVAGSVLAVTVVGLSSRESAADKDFTLAMKEGSRAKWDEAFNQTIARPFAKIECVAGKAMHLSLGTGCVDAGATQICCSSWTINLECTAARKWRQTNIQGSDCERKPAPK